MLTVPSKYIYNGTLALNSGVDQGMLNVPSKYIYNGTLALNSGVDQGKLTVTSKYISWNTRTIILMSRARNVKCFV